MIVRITLLLRAIIVILFLSLSLQLSGATYYVAPNGSDSNPGTLSSPWRTWQKAFDVAVAGDVVNIRGGVYYTSGISRGSVVTGVFASKKNGTSSSRIVIQAYQNEVPILDCSPMTANATRRGISLDECSYYTLKGLTVRNVKEYGQYAGCPTATAVSIQASKYINFERCVVHGSGNGFSTTGFCDYIDFLNCDAYDNIDFSDRGGFSNGWTLTMYLSPGVYAAGTHVTLKGCRSWGNSDDGFDMYGANGYFTYTDCWAFDNGRYDGNGDGFKSYETKAREPGVQRTFVRCLSFANKGSGFTSPPRAIENFFNCVSYSNRQNGFGFNTGDNLACTFRNNISYKNGMAPYAGLSNNICSNNTWNGKVTVTDADFRSVSYSGATGPRQSDGSLPVLDFMKLAPGSDLINAGVDVGFPYGGSAPDMGAYESDLEAYVPPSPVLSSAVVENATPSRIDLTFNLSLANVVPAASAFSVQVNSSARTVSSVTVSGTSVRLTLASPVAYGNTITVAYNAPSSNPLQTSSGGKVASFSARSVTNRLSAPPAIPVYQSSAIENTAPSVIVMTYNLSLANIVPPISAFSVQVNSSARNVTSVAVSGTSVRLTLASPVAYGNTVTVSYTVPSSNPLQTSAGGRAESISNRSVTNRISAPTAVPVYQSSAVENAAPSVIVMTYNLSLANIVPATSAFSVQVNSSARNVTAVAVSGTSVRLTLASPVAYGNTITVSYTVPSSNPLQTSSGGRAESISNRSVTNRVSAPTAIPVFTGASVENSAPSVVVMNYDLALAATTPSASAFTVTVNSSARTVSSVAVSGTQVRLTLSSPVVYGNTVTLAYARPSSNALQTSAGGVAASLSSQTVTNRVSPVATNNPPVINVNYAKNFSSGFIGTINASGSYDANKDNLTYTWKVPGNIPVSSTSGAVIEFLAPIVESKQTYNFSLTVSDGKSPQTKTIPVEVEPYQPGLDIAKIVSIETDNPQTPDLSYNIIDGNISTAWSCAGVEQSIILGLAGPFNVQYVTIAFQPGQRKEFLFDIFGSNDKQNWEPILVKSKSCAFSGNLQTFDFPATKADKEFRYVKIVGLGNATDDWNYISELIIFGHKHRNPADYEEHIVKLYPNPAREMVNIRIDEPTFNPDFIRIHTLAGKLIFTDEIDPLNRELQIPVNFKPGIYIVQMGTGEITVFTQKLVVTN